MNKDSYYMNIHTGSVATGEEWLEDLTEDFREVEKSTTEEDLEAWGEWKEVD